MNKCLAWLSLECCPLSDDDILLLADVLHKHPNLSRFSVALTNPFQPNIFTQFLRKVFASPSKSCLAEIQVSNRQYHPMKQQFKTYQAERRQDGLPQINLDIFNVEEVCSEPTRAENLAKANLDEDLLTGQ